MKTLFDFTDTHAIVTGGNRGIGEEISTQLQQCGSFVHIFDYEPSTTPAGVNSEWHPVDVRDPDSVANAVARLPENTTLLVNNAGITRDRTLGKMSDDEWHDVLAVNLTGAFNVIRALAPRLRAVGRGRIVNITSINGLRGKFGQGNYCAAKAGLLGLTKTAAREFGPHGITVNAVAPGMVMTPMSRNLPPEIIDGALSETTLDCLPEPADIAHAVLFLLSDAARMITGEVLRVDSGQYI
ncbi:MAG: SDR family oxidoreductase [Arenicellales bacterium]|nr:SDR family oxidoreductase [Arenicellales bacterium]MDP6552252.1 SDR family oxidoreductase [Arenicellales bacterium]MDP6790533.1 SDR family oxidoreductase [Arenicellales bacterium]MDP6917771.1 SDR family oxidoreductase [Arenicellales bacterium]